MTQDDRSLLEKGLIPTRVLASHLQVYLETLDDESLGLSVFSEKVGVDSSTLWGYINGERAGCEFDRADRILCALGKVDLWRGDLAEYYEGVNLSLRQCAHPNCFVWFSIPSSAKGGQRMYCTTACANSASRGNVRRKKTDVKPVLGSHARYCRNGHKRTPDTTTFLKNGKIRCRVCNNAGSARGYRRRKEAA